MTNAETHREGYKTYKTHNQKTCRIQGGMFVNRRNEFMLAISVDRLALFDIRKEVEGWFRAHARTFEIFLENFEDGVVFIFLHSIDNAVINRTLVKSACSLGVCDHLHGNFICKGPCICVTWTGLRTQNTASFGVDLVKFKDCARFELTACIQLRLKLVFLDKDWGTHCCEYKENAHSKIAKTKTEGFTFGRRGSPTESSCQKE